MPLHETISGKFVSDLYSDYFPVPDFPRFCTRFWASISWVVSLSHRAIHFSGSVVFRLQFSIDP
jgi:hypothetical protein